MPLSAIVIHYQDDRAAPLSVDNRTLVGWQWDTRFRRDPVQLAVVCATVLRLDMDTDFAGRRALLNPVELALDGLVDACLELVAAQDGGHPSAFAAACGTRVAAVDHPLLKRRTCEREDGAL